MIVLALTNYKYVTLFRLINQTLCTLFKINRQQSSCSFLVHVAEPCKETFVMREGFFLTGLVQSAEQQPAAVAAALECLCAHLHLRLRRCRLRLEISQSFPEISFVSMHLRNIIDVLRLRTLD